MIQQSQLSRFRGLDAVERGHLIDLLEEDVGGQKGGYSGDQQPLLREEAQMPDIQNQRDHLVFSLSLMEKQEENCLFPERFIGQAQDEDQFLINMPPSTTLPSPPGSSKRDSRVDKLAYLEEGRQAKIDRYLSKKKRRVWDRKVSYDCRKVVADSRQRVNGRFVKKSPVFLSSARKTGTPEPPMELQILKEFDLEGGGLEDCQF